LVHRLRYALKNTTRRWRDEYRVAIDYSEYWLGCCNNLRKRISTLQSELDKSTKDCLALRARLANFESSDKKE